MEEKSLKNRLPVLIPKAIAWAEEQAQFIRKNGTLLSPQELKIAQAVGVKNPELVRVFEIERLPLPEDVELKEAALSIGFLEPTMIGMAFGYGVYVHPRMRSSRLISHELRHVFQYEKAGSIANFLPVYLEQIVSLGYVNAPLEIDARESEIS